MIRNSKQKKLNIVKLFQFVYSICHVSIFSLQNDGFTEKQANDEKEKRKRERKKERRKEREQMYKRKKKKEQIKIKERE